MAKVCLTKWRRNLCWDRNNKSSRNKVYKVVVILDKILIKHHFPINLLSINSLFAIKIKNLPSSFLFHPGLSLKVNFLNMHRLLALFMGTLCSLLIQSFEIVHWRFESLVRELTFTIEPTPYLFQIKCCLMKRSLHCHSLEIFH